MRDIKPGITYVGAIDWDRRLFDELIPLPDGTSYNAYLVRGSEKVALLDTVDPETVDVIIDNLVKAGVDKIDYIVSHHGEQDHSGSIPDLLMLYPDAKVVANAKCKQMLIDLLQLEEDVFEQVADGDEISLGDRTLKFIDTPWVHWPETMSTYLKEDKVLFSCDFFGSHYATSSLFVDEGHIVDLAAKRYYAEIMMPFRSTIKNNLKKLQEYEIDMIAPSHGPVYDKPEMIMNAYKQWVSDEVKSEVVVAYVSMHNSTRSMVNHFVDSLIDRGLKVKPFDLAKADIGELAMALVDAATLIIGSPTVLIGAHPQAAYAAMLANALRPKTKILGIIGSFGWGSKMVEQLQSLVPNIKAEVLDPVLTKGFPKDEVFVELDDLAEKILAKHKELGIV